MKFYIVTPTFNSVSWLKNCIRSVADQVEAGVEVHHHVQDGLSNDGTPEWLENWQKSHADIPGYTFTYCSEKDKGMYDAINSAWEKLPQDADVTAHLNSDEQYLPHALKQVAEAYARYPHADIIEGTYIVVNSGGHYLFHRRPVSPHQSISATVCEMITCVSFHKAETFRRHGVRFDASYRSIADVLFFRDIISSGVRIKCLPGMVTTSYALTGSNLAWTDITDVEEKRYWATLSPITTRLHPIARRYANGMRMVIDKFCRAPRELSIYRGDDDERTVEIITKHSCRWNNRRV